MNIKRLIIQALDRAPRWINPRLLELKLFHFLAIRATRKRGLESVLDDIKIIYLIDNSTSSYKIKPQTAK